MAYVRSTLRPEDEQQQKAGLVTEAPTSGAAPSGSVANPAPTSSGQYDDIRSFILANQGEGQRMANDVAGDLKSSAESAVSGVKGGTLESPVTTTPNPHGGQNRGGTANIDPLVGSYAAIVDDPTRAKATEAAGSLEMAGSRSGLETLVGKKGGNALDALLVEANADPLNKLRGQYGDLLAKIRDYQRPEDGWWVHPQQQPVLQDDVAHNPVDGAGNPVGAEPASSGPLTPTPGSARTGASPTGFPPNPTPGQTFTDTTTGETWTYQPRTGWTPNGRKGGH